MNIQRREIFLKISYKKDDEITRFVQEKTTGKIPKLF